MKTTDVDPKCIEWSDQDVVPPPARAARTPFPWVAGGAVARHPVGADFCCMASRRPTEDGVCEGQVQNP